jgi:ribosomal protein S18 acetylase RimI-like enzyme
MCDQWMPFLQLPLTIEQFHQLPRHAAYKYEYIAGQAWLTPRPKHYHALLDLHPIPVEDDVPVRRLQADDWDDLVSLFAAAFFGIQPFGSLEDDPRRDAARACLERTRTGGDGPIIEQASFVAMDRESQNRIGAILLTLLPDADPTGWDAFHWPEPPHADCIVRRLGRPHLTWIFVSPWVRGEGTGTALLAAAVRELLALGYTQLATTFLAGNESSMLWHWRNGFRLVAHPGSKRRMRKELDEFLQ